MNDDVVFPVELDPLVWDSALTEAGFSHRERAFLWESSVVLHVSKIEIRVLSKFHGRHVSHRTKLLIRRLFRGGDFSIIVSAPPDP